MTHQQILDGLIAIDSKYWAFLDQQDELRKAEKNVLQLECAGLGHMWGGGLFGRQCVICETRKPANA